MSKDDFLKELRSKGLMPHQIATVVGILGLVSIGPVIGAAISVPIAGILGLAAGPIGMVAAGVLAGSIIKKFNISKKSNKWEIVTPIGSGKSTIGCAVISYIMGQSNHARALVLMPASVLLPQWENRIREFDTSVQVKVVNRKQYLAQVLSANKDNSPWHESCVYVMSIDLAKSEDIADSLTKTKWDLMLVDESHSLTGRRLKVVQEIMSTNPDMRALFLTATPSASIPNVERVTIKANEMPDWKNQPLVKPAPLTTSIIRYHQTQDEKQFILDLKKVAKDINNIYPIAEYSELTVIATSSTLAIESKLRRLKDTLRPIRNRVAHGLPPIDKNDLRKEESHEQPSGAFKFNEDSFYKAFTDLEKLLLMCSEIKSDSKFDALLSHITGSGDRPDFRICICTSYRRTADYLTSVLENHDFAIHLIHSGITLEQVEDSLNVFQSHGGILIITDSVLDGISLEFVDECINYDIPIGVNKMKRRLSRFYRMSIEKGFKLTFLRDEDSSQKSLERIIRLVENSQGLFSPDNFEG